MEKSSLWRPAAALAAAAIALLSLPALAAANTVTQGAAPSASYTAPWNNIDAVNDEVIVFTGGSNSQVWGTYANRNRPAQQWLQYDWAAAHTFTGASMSFWHDNASDTAGTGVAVPQDWVIQAWVNNAWQDLAIVAGTYPRAKTSTNVVTFSAPVTTTALRAVFDATTNGSTYAAVGVSEWEVNEEAGPPAPSDPTSGVPTASYTASWNNINAVFDGVDLYTGGTQDQLWGTWSNSRPAQQWLQYDWSGQHTFSGASIAFWHDNASDTAGDGVAVPQDWRIQAWVDNAWQDLTITAGTYPRSKTSANAVTFASPVTTNALRAVFDATTDGVTYAAVGVSEYTAFGDAPVEGPGGPIASLSSSAFSLGVSTTTGGVYELSNPSDVYGTNYVANPTIHPAWDIDDSRWVGDVVMSVDGQPRMTSLSDDIRTVTGDGSTITVAYSGTPASQYGIQGFDLTQTYSLSGANGEVLDWDFQIDNTSGASMTIEDLALPMLMNAWWNGGDQTGIYEQNVARHSFVAKDGSYVYWQRPNGEGPYLVMVPKAGTSLEFRNKARTGEGPFGEKDPEWEGLVEFAIHSANLQPARAGLIEGYLPATSATVPAGQSATYGFTFRWAADYADLHDVLYDAGVVDVVSLPGMVIPTDLKATLAVRAAGGIEAVTGEAGKSIGITSLGAQNGYELYELTLPTLGRQKVTVTFDGGRESVLQYYAIEPIEALIDLRSDFLVNNQQASTTYSYDGAFLQWDMSTQQLITWHNYPGGGWKQWMAGGSDDLGLAPALYLAEKNLVDPVQSEIDAIDYYIDTFLLGYLQAKTSQGQRTWEVYRWYDGCEGTPCDTGTWRVYNYTHIANTYFHMYQLKKAYPNISTSRPALEYLDMAYRTLDAMYNKVSLPTPIGADPAHDLGLMGEGTYIELLAALQAENMTVQAAALQSELDGKRDSLFVQKYPFASEASIDTTGFEASYTFAKMYSNEVLKDRVQNASLSARGLQPLWYYYGGDNRHMGESWWNLGYETHLGAWQQQDYLANEMASTAQNFDDAMRSTYGAYVAGWANINSGQISSAPANIGAVSWQYQSQLGAAESPWAHIPQIDGWWAWSGEAELGFWGGLRVAEVAVVDDDIAGTYAYGGELVDVGGTYTITPKDGVRQRLTLYNRGAYGIELTGARYSSATVNATNTDVSLTVERVAGAGGSVEVALTNAPDGTYDVELDGSIVGSFTVAGGSGTASVTVAGTGGAIHLVQQ